MRVRIALFIILAAFLLPITKLYSQTEVRRYYANKENKYGVVYTLPKSLIEVSFTIEESKYTPGYLASYAELYLSRRASTHPETNYEIISSNVRSVGVPDTTKRFLVVFDKNTIAPFVALTDMGIIASINGKDSIGIDSKPAPLFSQWSSVDTQLPAMPDTYQLATSKAQQALIASEHLTRINQSIMDIVTGDVEEMPKDGESMRIVMDRLHLEEQRTKRLFLGDTIRRTQNVRIYIDPTLEDINNRTILRFSPIYGIVSDIDLSGEPIKLDLKVIDRQPERTPKEMQKFLKSLDGIVYNLPGRAEVSLRSEDRILYNGVIPITQAGSMQLLREDMFNTKGQNPVEVYFDIHTGNVKKITQQ